MALAGSRTQAYTLGDLSVAAVDATNMAGHGRAADLIPPCFEGMTRLSRRGLREIWFSLKQHYYHCLASRLAALTIPGPGCTTLCSLRRFPHRRVQAPSRRCVLLKPPHPRILAAVSPVSPACYGCFNTAFCNASFQRCKNSWPCLP